MAAIDTMRDLDRLAGALFSTRPSLRAMPMDVYRRGNEYVLTADLPGIDPASIDVDLDGQQLTIRAERVITETEGVKWIMRERSGGTFVRQLTMGEGIDTAKISATYSEGVLTVVMPVRESAQPRKITVEKVEGTAQNQQAQIDS